MLLARGSEGRRPGAGGERGGAVPIFGVQVGQVMVPLIVSTAREAATAMMAKRAKSLPNMMEMVYGSGRGRQTGFVPFLGQILIIMFFLKSKNPVMSQRPQYSALG